MKDVQNAVYSIVETRGKECYCILCHAIDVAIEHQPNMPRMQVICNEVRIRTGKRTNEAVSRALNRAAKDIWQNGRRRELRAYWIEEPPTAKELISLISAKLWAIHPRFEAYVVMRHGACVRRTGLSSLRGSLPQQRTDCHSGKAHYRSIRFCGLTIPFDN